MKKRNANGKQVKILSNASRPLDARELVGLVKGAAADNTTVGVLRGNK